MEGPGVHSTAVPHRRPCSRGLGCRLPDQGLQVSLQTLPGPGGGGMKKGHPRQRSLFYNCFLLSLPQTCACAYQHKYHILGDLHKGSGVTTESSYKDARASPYVCSHISRSCTGPLRHMRVPKWSGVPLPTFMVPCLNPRSNREGGEGQASPGDALQEACAPIRSASRPEGRRHSIGALGAAGEGWAQVWGRRAARAGPGPGVPGSLPSAGPGSCAVLSQPRPGVQPLCSRPRLCPRCRACSARQWRGLR